MASNSRLPRPVHLMDAPHALYPITMYGIDTPYHFIGGAHHGCLLHSFVRMSCLSPFRPPVARRDFTPDL